jgi:hypothetical protein
MTGRGIALILSALLCAEAGAAPFEGNGASLAGETEAKAALAKLRALAGEWQGTFEWTGARHDKGEMGARYYVTGHDSAVIENLIADGVPTMTSAYHLDHADLRVTHFCGTQNQPRLKAERLDLAQGAIDFALVDVTNLASPDAPHVVSLGVRFVDAEHITIIFGFTAGGKSSEERISLRRVGNRAL